MITMLNMIMYYDIYGHHDIDNDEYDDDDYDDWDDTNDEDGGRMTM